MTEDAGPEDLIRVEVAFALPDRQEVVELNVAKGCTALEAVGLSRLNELFPDCPLADAPMGIFSRPMNGRDLPAPDRYVLEENDRVEIYRPLAVDPKQARLERARKKASPGASKNRS